ncbi:MAG TPA: RcnB family protein [Allosphingosinicella sp.]|nr:RcnB family protein [Allosphingosinicella sp.]
MSKLWLIGLAASAAWTPAAMAQGAPPPPPPPPMAHGAHAPGHAGHGAMMQHGGGHRVSPPAIRGGHMNGMRGGGGRMDGMKGWQRFGRGHVVPPHFRGGQFIVRDWRSFGFPAPVTGGQWIRYYDDALLVDGHGRVMDSRYGWDWDRRGGDLMAYDHGGYDEDYAEDDHGRDHHGSGGGDYGHHGKGDRGGHMPPPPPHPGYGHGYGQSGGYGSGYGYGYSYGAGCGCGPVVVTETITTTAPVVEMRTYYETVREHRAAPRRHYSKPAVRRSVKPVYRAAPRPRPGERG